MYINILNKYLGTYLFNKKYYFFEFSTVPLFLFLIEGRLIVEVKYRNRIIS